MREADTSRDGFGPVTNKEYGQNKVQFLQSVQTVNTILDSFTLDGFQMGGSAVDLVLKTFRRPHHDIDMVYIVQTRTWKDYLADPMIIPDERKSLQNLISEPGFYNIGACMPLDAARMGAPVIRMEGLPLPADLVEAYIDTEAADKQIMLPLYNGGAHIRIPQNEIVSTDIDGIMTHTPSAEMQLLLKEQATNLFITVRGGLLPDLRTKVLCDMADLRQHVDRTKVTELQRSGAGYHFSFSVAANFYRKRLMKQMRR